ncbi:MAG: carboxypeptidase regulatory-like domain-containing protein [Pyrinomonadaceae bacterium]
MFDVDGKVTTQIGGAEDVALAVAIQPDGKIVCAGYSSGVSTIAFVVRYNADGSLDTSFNGTGKVTENFAGGLTLATSIGVQSDGKILVGGYTSATSGRDFFLLRYNSNGTLDPSFDGDGKITTDFASRDEADALFIQPLDGKIVLTGETNNNTPNRTFAALARYNTDGSPDNSFGTGGKVISHEGAAYSVLIQPDGQLVTGGWGCAAATCTSNLDYTFARYNANGSLDATFGTGGKATVAVSNGRDEARAIALQTDGKIVAVGANLSSAVGDPIAVVRLNANGTPDTSFGTNGIVQNLPVAVENAFGLGIQANGKIVASGRIYPTSTDSDFALLRLNTNGTPDTTFSGDGFATTSFANNLDGIIDLAIQSDGKIVAVGFAENQIGDIDAAVARYLSPVTVSGRVLTPDGRGLVNAKVSITGLNSAKRTVLTSSFGFYSFDNVLTGDTYTVAVKSKLYLFTSQTFLINDDFTAVNFTGQE